MVRLRIENVVAAGKILDDLDFEEVKAKVKEAKSRPRFPGLILRLERPRSTVLLFRGGKIVITGLRRTSDVKDAVRELLNILKKAGLQIEKNIDVRVVNVVASADFGVRFNLTALNVALGIENAEYHPEIFPGLIYRRGRISFLIFGSGQTVVVGGESEEEISRELENFKYVLESSGFFENGRIHHELN